MNARGKLLSQFENFKAGLEKLIIDYDWEHGKRQTEKFSLKIDTEWTDYFWTNFKRYNSVDSAHMRFISAIAMYRTALDKFKIKADERSQIIAKLNDDTNFVKPHHFSKDAFIYLVKCYEIYCNLNEEKKNLELTFPLWRHQPNNSFLSEIVFENGHRTSYTLKVLFYAQTEYLMRVSNFKNSYFSDWMRVIRNIVSRGDVDKDGNRPDIIRSPQTFDGIITLISELAEGCNNIYDYLATSPSIKSTFAKEQIEEERIKAQLIRSEPNLKPLIWKLEDNELLRGRIEFVFYCIDFEKESGSINRGLMARVQDVFERYFNSETVPIDLRRAMLTIAVNGEYEFYNYWWSFWNVASATKRKLFANYREIEYFIYSEQREYFKKLVIELTQKDFSQIINEFQPPQSMPNWKVRLIKDKDLLNKKSNSNYIAIPDDNSCCYLLKSKRPRDMDGCIVIK
jgi:hypothetical protein